VASLAGVGYIVAADDILCHEESGEAFLLHVPSGRYFGLNATGLTVWQALTAGEDPVTALRRKWPDAAEHDCRADTQRLLASLSAAGLVKQRAEQQSNQGDNPGDR